MPDFPAWTPEDWSALSAGVTAIVAVVAALFAFLQVRQARLLREEQAQPFVVVDFESSAVWQNAIELVIENIGKTVARDVRVTFDPPLESTEQHEGYDLSKSVLLAEGIPTMPPGKRVAALFDLSHKRYDSGLPMSYVATVNFSDARGKRQDALTYVLDLNFRYGLMRFTEYGLHDGVKAIREIRDTMKKWTAVHPRGLRVYTVDDDARRFDERWQMEHGGHPPTLANPTPAGRRSPSRFDRYKEPLWKRAVWGLRLAARRRKRREELRAEMWARPDLAPMLQRELELLESFRVKNRLRGSLFGAKD